MLALLQLVREDMVWLIQGTSSIYFVDFVLHCPCARSKTQSTFGSMLSALEAKYGGGSEENEPFNEPTEAEFEAARQRMQARAPAGRGSSKPAKRSKK